MASQVGGGEHGSLPDEDAWSVYDEVTLGNPYYLSSRTRTFLRLVSLILVFAITALFVQGFIHT